MNDTTAVQVERIILVTITRKDGRNLEEKPAVLVLNELLRVYSVEYLAGDDNQTDLKLAADDVVSSLAGDDAFPDIRLTRCTEQGAREHFGRWRKTCHQHRVTQAKRTLQQAKAELTRYDKSVRAFFEKIVNKG